MSEPAESPVIDVSPATARALCERGGNLYVWADGAGMPHADIDRPTQTVSYNTTTSPEGWSIHIDSSIEPPRRWLIKWRRLPWPHFVARYNPPEFRWTRPTLRDVFAGLWQGFRNSPWP